MFNGHTVWRGIVYSILMLVAKLLCGAWLFRFSLSLPYPASLRKVLTAMKHTHVSRLWGRQTLETQVEPPTDGQGTDEDIPIAHSTSHDAANLQSLALAESDDTMIRPCAQVLPQAERHNAAVGTVPRNKMPAPKPFSLYPCAILGLAMIARGEIGFLISSLAKSNGIFSIGDDDQMFLVVTRAILICTVVGPLGVGLLVRRVRRLEKVREGRNDGRSDGRNVLGAWGIA